MVPFTLRASSNPGPGGVQRKRWKAKYFQTAPGGRRNISGALRRRFQLNLDAGDEVRILARYRLKHSPGSKLSKRDRTRPFHLVAHGGGNSDRAVAKVIRKR